MSYRGRGTATQPAAPARVATKSTAVVPRATAVAAGPLTTSSQTAKGRAIRAEMDALDEEYFGKAEQPTTTSSGDAVAKATSNSTFVRPTVYPQLPLSPSWATGPVDPAGRMMDASDRNLLCMDVMGHLVVAGGADHGLTVWNLNKGTRERALFTKTNGHTEWVTACAFTPSGQIVSGAMDSSLLLWGRAGTACEGLTHSSETHRAGISALAVGGNGVVISASYDRTLKLWNTTGRGSNAFLGTMSGHTAPVTHLVWREATVFSGDRKGTAILWDAATQKGVLSMPTTGGQIGSIGAMIDDEFHLLLAGDQKGVLSVWDARSDPSRPVAQSHLHGGGVVSSVISTTMNSDNYIVTAGADKQMHCIDPRGGFDKPVFSWTDHRDFIYAVESHANMIFSAGGNGWLLAHDVDAGKCAYGIGAGQNAMRCISTTDSRVICAGDDGKIMSFDFP